MLLRIISIGVAGVVAYQSIPRDAGDLTAAQVAQGAQGRLPVPVGNGASVVAIRAEFETLAFHVDGPSGWLRDLTREQVAGAMRGSLCRDDALRLILASGKSVRVDVSSDGAPPKAGELIRDCPDDVGSGGSGGGT